MSFKINLHSGGSMISQKGGVGLMPGLSGHFTGNNGSAGHLGGTCAGGPYLDPPIVQQFG